MIGIHELIPLERPLISVDTETTGTDAYNDRVVEIGFEVWTAEGLQKKWRSLINPGVPIPSQATETHNITDLQVRGCRVCGSAEPDHVQPAVLTNLDSGETSNLNAMALGHPFEPHYSFKQIAPSLAKDFVGCDFAGKNIRFDLRIIAAEMHRAGVPWSYAGARLIDADRLEQLAIPRTLSHMYEKYTGRPMEGAHGAAADAAASLEIIVRQLSVHRQLPRSLDELHAMSWPGWIDTEGKFRFVAGVPYVKFGKHKDKPMKSVPGDYWDWILKADFTAEIKNIAAAVKLGKYPEAPSRNE